MSATRFYALLEEAKLDACAASAAVRKFDYIIHNQPQQVAEAFLEKDINSDGGLNLDGFKSAVLMCELSDYRIALPELKEIFDLISDEG